MLNHQVVKPLKAKTVTHNATLTDKEAMPIAAHAVMKPGWDKIKTTRAQMCVDMLKEHGIVFKSKDKCVVFMDKQCKVESKPICKEWYDLLAKLESGEIVIAGAPSGAPPMSPAAAAGMVKDGEDEIEEAEREALGEGVHAKAIGAKYGGKGAAWSNMKNEGAKMPEQGFEGKLVAHDNMVTHTEDWQMEYGPRADHLTHEAICAQYPDNQWCRLRGYHVKTSVSLPPKSSTLRLLVTTPSLAFAFLALLC